MPRARGADAGFLYMESADTPVVSVNCVQLAPRVGADGARQLLRLDELRARLLDRLDVVPWLRWKLVEVPFGLHHPVLADDPDFDIDRHLDHVVLTDPDDFDRVVTERSSRSLPRDRPLWHITLVDGAAGGRQIIVLGLQHVLVDGTATLNAVRALFDDRRPKPARTYPAEPVPTRRRLVRDALHNQRAQLRALPALVRETRAGIEAARAHEADCAVTVPKVVKDTPPCLFNDAYGPNRASRRTELDLAELKRIKTAAGCTLNDVCLAVVAGAVREYLLARDALPERPLVVDVPVATDPGSPRVWGNGFTNIATTLATDIADPWARLQAIAAVSPAAKERIEVFGNQTVARWLDYALPALARPGQRAITRYRLRHRDRVDMNTLVSNLRVSDDAWPMGDHEVERFFIYGPPTDLKGLNFTLCSFGDAMVWAIQAHAEVLDDPDELVAAVHESLRALSGAAEAAGRRASVAATP